MSAIQPQDIFESLAERFRRYFDGSNIPGQMNAFELAQIRRDIDRLAVTNRVLADRASTTLETWLYDYDRCQEIIVNIVANGELAIAKVVSFNLDTNFLYATKALGLLEDVFENPVDVEYYQLLSSASALGAFHAISEGIEAANRKQMVIKVTKLVAIARQAQEVLAGYGITDASVAKCVDLAGELMREKRLLWMGAGPDVLVVPPSTGEPSVSIDYRLPISAKEASAMTWQLTNRLIESDLDFPGLYIGFLGVVEKAQAA